MYRGRAYASINNQWRPMSWSTCTVTRALPGGALAAWSVILCPSLPNPGISLSNTFKVSDVTCLGKS